MKLMSIIHHPSTSTKICQIDPNCLFIWIYLFSWLLFLFTFPASCNFMSFCYRLTVGVPTSFPPRAKRLWPDVGDNCGPATGPNNPCSAGGTKPWRGQSCTVALFADPGCNLRHVPNIQNNTIYIYICTNIIKHLYTSLELELVHLWRLTLGLQGLPSSHPAVDLIKLPLVTSHDHQLTIVSQGITNKRNTSVSIVYPRQPNAENTFDIIWLTIW